MAAFGGLLDQASMLMQRRDPVGELGVGLPEKWAKHEGWAENASAVPHVHDLEGFGGFDTKTPFARLAIDAVATGFQVCGGPRNGGPLPLRFV